VVTIQQAMNAKTAGYLIFYGGFLLIMGLLGYSSNPEKAKTALITGVVFGGLSIGWGVLGARGAAWSRVAAIVTASLLALAAGWRAILSWLAVYRGESEKLFAALIITAMLVASILMVGQLVKYGREPDRAVR
jgi:hypothetical protein